MLALHRQCCQSDAGRIELVSLVGIRRGSQLLIEASGVNVRDDLSGSNCGRLDEGGSLAESHHRSLCRTAYLNHIIKATGREISYLPHTREEVS